MHCAFAKAFCGHTAQKRHATCASHLVRERCCGTGVKHHTFEIHFERAAIVTLNKHMPAPSKVLWRENKTDKQEAILLNTMLNLITRQT